MPLYWIEVETAEVINSGWLQAAQDKVLQAEQDLVALGAATAALIVGAANYLYGSRSQGASFPTTIIYHDPVTGVDFPMSFSWTCGWDGGKIIPPA